MAVFVRGAAKRVRIEDSFVLHFFSWLPAGDPYRWGS